MSPGGRWLACGFSRGGAGIWDTTSGERVRPLSSREGVVQFSPDGRWLIFGEPSLYRLFRTSDWTELWQSERTGLALSTAFVAFSPGAVPAACGDENLLHHILGNLLSNAVKYSPPGHPVQFKVEQKERDAIFTIRDEGVGIPVADETKLFTAFHRARNVRQISGTGLGLTIAKRCVELHRGEITFVSEEGHGTTFVVRLPLFGSRADAAG